MTLYFAYGSNLSTTQMRQRCPQSELLGVACLRGWTWIINERGYANVVEATAGTNKKNDLVFGLVYNLSADDEARLDECEGVPWAYTKTRLELNMRRCYRATDDDGGPTKQDTTTAETWLGESGLETVAGLVYVDRQRTRVAEPKEEYVERMQRAVRESATVGVPRDWLHDVIGKYVDLGEDVLMRLGNRSEK